MNILNALSVTLASILASGTSAQLIDHRKYQVIMAGIAAAGSMTAAIAVRQSVCRPVRKVVINAMIVPTDPKEKDIRRNK